MMANIKDHPFWKKRSLLTDIDSRHLFKIKKYNTAIRNFANDPANAERLQEFTKKHRQNFADEIICRTPEENNDENICEREERRQRYIAELIPKLFGEGLVARSLKMGFDEDTAKQLHVIIGKDKIDGAGNYRTNEVKPAYCSYLYLESSRIESKLNKLFKDINLPIEPDRDDWCEVATKFFDRFLYIHPFKDGNGKIARILLSALLINYTIIPLCLFGWRYDANKLYIDVLEEAHNPKTRDTTYLKSFIIDAVYYTLYNCIQELNIEDD